MGRGAGEELPLRGVDHLLVAGPVRFSRRSLLIAGPFAAFPSPEAECASRLGHLASVDGLLHALPRALRARVSVRRL